MIESMMLPLGTIAIALAQRANTQKQLAWQKSQFEQNQAFQRESQHLQRLFQIKSQDINHARQIRQQVAQYTLTNAWPLRLPPTTIAANILSEGEGDSEVPLNLIIAPSSGGLQQNFSYIWGDLARFIQQYFAFNSRNPVVTFQGAYKPNYVSNPNNDVLAIYEGLKSVPTIFIAPYSTGKDSVLGVTIAMWGIGDTGAKPTMTQATWDMEKLIRKILRDEANDYLSRINDGRLDPGVNPNIEKNIEIFKKEQALLSKGNSEDDIACVAGIYKGLIMNDNTIRHLGDEIFPQVALFASAMCDLYWTMEYGHAPRLPQIIQTSGIANAASVQSCLGQYADALLSGREWISPRHMINLSADFHLLGAEATARRLISNDISLVCKDSFAGDMASMAMCERKEDVDTLLPDNAKALLRNWGRNQHKFGALELGLLKGDNVMNSSNCITAAQECFSLGRAERAFELLNIAARNGDSDAMWMIGACFYLGQGVERNTTLARYWCEKSASEGNKKGEEYLNEMNLDFIKRGRV